MLNENCKTPDGDTNFNPDSIPAQDAGLLDILPDDGVGDLLREHGDELLRITSESDDDYLRRIRNAEMTFGQRALRASNTVKEARTAQRAMIIAGALVLLDRKPKYGDIGAWEDNQAERLRIKARALRNRLAAATAIRDAWSSAVTLPKQVVLDFTLERIPEAVQALRDGHDLADLPKAERPGVAGAARTSQLAEADAPETAQETRLSGAAAAQSKQVAPEWLDKARALLDDADGRFALDALLASRGLHITPVKPTPRPKNGREAPSRVDTSGWSIRESEVQGARVTVATADLCEALRVMPHDTADDDMAGHVAFRVLGERLEVLSYRGRLFAASPVRADGEVGCSWTMGAKRLKTLVKAIKDETVVIGFDANLGASFVQGADSTLTFECLNPDSFPFWDKIQAGSKPTATVPARRLAAALAYSQLFVSEDEAGSPDLCVSEAREGIIYSTNQRAATLVRVPGLDLSNLRVHGEDAKALCAFLNTCKDGDVELLEHDRALFIRRGDGAVFGEVRFTAAFPGLKVNMDEKDQRVWTLAKEAILMAMAQLDAIAHRIKVGKRLVKDNRLRFVHDPEGRAFRLSMFSARGDKAAVDVPLIDTLDTPDAPPLPAAGFVLDRESLRKVLSAWDGDAIKFGVNVIPAKNRGFCRFVFEGDGNTYLTIAAWLIESAPEPQPEQANNEEVSGEVLDEPVACDAVDEAQAHGEVP